MISSYHLSQEITEPTRVTAETQTLIDLIIKTPTLNTIKSGVYHSSISDHSLVYCILQRKCPKPSIQYKTVRSYKKFISEKFRADVSQLPLKDCLKTNDINEAVSKWNELYTNTLNKHAPVRKIKVRSKPKPWFTQGLQSLINNRDNTRKKAIATKSEIVWKQYQVEKKSIIKAVRDAKDSFFQKTLTECKNNPKQMWNCIKRLAPTKKQSNPLPPEWLNKDQANKLNTFFSEIGVMTQNKLQPNKRCFPFPLDIRSKFSFKTVKSPEVKNLLLNIPSNKATGADNIDIKSLKIVAGIASSSIASILNLSIASAQFPAIWKSSLITPVFTAGAKTAIANYRPVSV